MFIADASANASPSLTSSASTPADFNAATGGEPSILMSLAPLVLVAIVMMFLIVLPQKKIIKQHKTMIDSLRRGDKVVTGGGIIGTIHKIEADDTLVIEVAPDVKVRVLRDTISNVMTKTVANDNKSDDK